MYVPYPLFAFVGLVPWTFFANAVTTSSNSLVSSTHLISKVYFPRLLVPAGAVAACLFDFALSFLALLGMLAFYRVRPTANILMLPPLVALMAGFALGVGMWLSSLNVKYRDVRFVLPFLIQLWLFASSVILPSSAVPESLRWLLYLNPMSGVVEGFRSALLGLPFDWRAIGVTAAATAAVLVYAAYSFRRRSSFATSLHIICVQSSWLDLAALPGAAPAPPTDAARHAGRVGAFALQPLARRRCLARLQEQALGAARHSFDVRPGAIVGSSGATWRAIRHAEILSRITSRRRTDRTLRGVRSLLKRTGFHP